MNTADKVKSGGKASFAMVFHCHQPVFNLQEAIGSAYNRAYLPLVRTLEDFPGVKATFHFSGSTLEWLESRHPEMIDLLKKLLRRGQIELLGGGCYEPVMAIIPERDRRHQLAANRGIIERIFGITPAGAWIAERVWEPELARTLSGEGLKFSVVDDHHIFASGMDGKTVFRPCRVSGGGQDLIVLPSLSRLRYSMPFRPPEATVSSLKDWYADGKGDRPCFVFADDGEKFGAWPRTYAWVHRRGWLRSFFGMLEENAGWLETVTCSEMVDTADPEDIGDIRPSSYAEMMEWSGGDFRNFLKKYPESARMHRRMMALSELIDRMEDGHDAKRRARKELMKAQTGCAYWHGTFGGVYLPYFREGVYRHIIEAENILNGRGGDRRVRVSAFESGDPCGAGESLLKNRYLDIFIDPAKGGALCEIDDRRRRVNLLNTMGRTKEAYHVKVRKEYAPNITKARRAVLKGNFADIHDVLGVSEKGLEKVLSYDDHPRYAFLTHIAPPEGGIKEISSGGKSSKNFLNGAYTSGIEGDSDFITATLRRRDKLFLGRQRKMDLEVVKKITVGSAPAAMFTHSIARHSGGPSPISYAVEFNIFVRDRGYMGRGRYMKKDRVSFLDMHTGSGMEFFLEKEREIWTYPIYTVNESEEGLKKTFQGISVLFGGIAFAPGHPEGVPEEMRITLAVG